MRYVIKKRCLSKINTFYRNVSKKYKHTYSEELMHQNVDEAIDSMFQIERTLLRREPTISRWAGYHMANQEHYSMRRFKARKKETEILYIFFGIHTANAVLMAERLETKEQAKAA